MQDDPGAERLDPRVRLLHHLGQPPEQVPIDDDEAVKLVVYAVTCWSDWWASKALDWVEQGVWNEEVAASVRRTSRDRRYSQETRHRARARVKP